MCSIIIREIDLSIVREECERRGITLEQFIELSKQVVGLSQEQVCQQIPSEYKEINIEQYIDYFKRIPELLNITEFCRQQEYYIKLLSELTGKEAFYLDDFSAININTPYGQKINSVYCFGICFILLHEASHFLLDIWIKKVVLSKMRKMLIFPLFGVFTPIYLNLKNFLQIVGFFVPCSHFST